MTTENRALFHARTLPASDLRATWADANAAGRSHADTFMAIVAAEGAPFMLGRVVEDLIEAGRFDGVVVGFMHRIAEYALRGHSHDAGTPSV